jgi:hypothetical protein
MAGYLFSKISFIGRLGISLFYNNYAFFKTWWKGGLLVFVILMVMLVVHTIAHRYFNRRNAIMFHAIAAVCIVLGVYMTYQDFRHTLSHHLAGERFHLGAYCFWLGWVSICLYYLVSLLKRPTGDN